MKTITPPADVRLVDYITKQSGDTVSFNLVATTRWINNDAAKEQLTDFLSVHRWSRVTNKLAESIAEVPFTLDDADYAMLLKVVESDVTSFPPVVAVQLISIYAAVIEAK